MQTTPYLRTRHCALLGLALIASASFAQPAGNQNPQGGQNQQSGPGGQGPGERRHRPPPEAIAACQGLASNAACTFTNRQNQPMTGTCFAPPPREAGASGEQKTPPLACRPTGGRPGGPNNGQAGGSERPNGPPPKR